MSVLCRTSTGLSVWLAGAILAMPASSAEKIAKGQGPVPAKREVPVSRLAVSLLEGVAAAGQHPTMVLSGTELAVLVDGAPSGLATWQVACAGVVLKQGKIPLDADGRGKVRIVAPDVRHRAECELRLTCGDQARTRRIVVFPTGRLADSAGLLARLGLGIVDETGSVQAAVKADGGVAQNLPTQLAEEAFTGKVVVLAGFKRPELLAITCRRFESRLKAGLSLVIVNPPVGWRRWGVEYVSLATPAKAPGRLAEEFGGLTQAADLGSGPWQGFLKGPTGATEIAWFPQVIEAPKKDKPKKDKPNSSKPLRRSLALVVKVGKGRAIVMALPQMKRLPSDAVGRSMLNDTILWILGVHLPSHRKEP